MDGDAASGGMVKAGAVSCETRAPQFFGKFEDPKRTADGAPRAHAPFRGLKSLWLNTGTLCNLACVNCYIESTPTNDSLVYLTAAEAAPFIDEAAHMEAEEIGLTGGEPFMNPHTLAIIRDAAERGMRVLTLTNAMRPMMRPAVRGGLLALHAAFGARLQFRVSLDHHGAALHDGERAKGSFDIALEGLAWLFENGFHVSIASRTFGDENEDAIRAGFADLFHRKGFPLDAQSGEDLVVFPEMDEARDVPEITHACWGILGKSPADVMCASSRMVVKRKGALAPAVVACTLIPYDDRFDMGASVKEAARAVSLNHPHCATFCVLGGASCSG
ncbi:MAG: radical SAM protein [Pseudomonadota bacterium]